MAYTGHRGRLRSAARADGQAAEAAHALLRRHAGGCGPVEAHVRCAPACAGGVFDDHDGDSPARCDHRLLRWLLYINWRLTLMTFFVLPIVAVVIRYSASGCGALRATCRRAPLDDARARGNDRRTPDRAHLRWRDTSAHAPSGREFAAQFDDQAVVGERRQFALTQMLAALAVVHGVIIGCIGAEPDGKLDLGMFASYLVALLTLLERLKALSGINAAIQRGLAPPKAFSGARPRGGAGRRHRGAPRHAASSSSIASRCATAAPSGRRWSTFR